MKAGDDAHLPTAGRPPERPAVLVTYDPPVGERALIGAALDDLADIRFLADLDDGDRADALAFADALLSWSPGRDLRAGELRSATRVRLVQLLSAGADTVDFDTVPSGVTVAANVGAYAQPMAEHVLGMTLALAKRLPANHSRLAAGEYPADPETTELRGAVAGIVGFGGIGRACADLFRPLGMRIHAINTSGTTGDDVEFVGTTADLERVLRVADVVVVAIPLTRDTRGLIGARELAWMKPTALLINVARAAVVDEAALYDHLAATPGFSAGIDVWWDEPERGAAFHQRFPFLELPNVLGSPHNSGIVPGMMERAAGDAARNVARFLRGEHPQGVQRPEDYSSSARIE
jgi:phosphoglycerate dehydrogenase-like enzyme